MTLLLGGPKPGFYYSIWDIYTFKSKKARLTAQRDTSNRGILISKIVLKGNKWQHRGFPVASSVAVTPCVDTTGKLAW